MNLQPQPYGDPVNFEQAAISLEAVRALLEREGHIEEARTLRGLEVLSPSGAEVALDALRSIRVRSTDVNDALLYAATACKQAAYAPRNAA